MEGAAVSLGSGLATLLLAEADDDGRGDIDRTDAIAAALRCFDPAHAARAGRGLLAERALWAATRNNERSLDEQARLILGIEAHGTPSVRFCQAILDRRPTGLSDQIACAWWWLLAPRRRQTWPILIGREPLLRRASAPARLWNSGAERLLGNAIFRSLLEEARAVGDTRASEVHAANVACGV
jgi:hypothetical protein